MKHKITKWKVRNMASLLYFVSFIPLITQAEIIQEGAVSSLNNLTLGNDGYYDNGNRQIQIGPGKVGKVTINNGTKLKSGEAHIGNHQNGDGTMIVDGVGSEWVLNGRLDVGNSYAKGALYILNGARVLQNGTHVDDNYFAHYNDSIIKVVGEGSILKLDNTIRAYSDSRIFLEDKGELRLNNHSASLPHLVNAGKLFAEKQLYIEDYLQIGSSDGSQAGEFDLKEGLYLYQDAKAVIKKLKNDSDLLITGCSGCSIEYDTKQNLTVELSDNINTNLTLTNGKITLKDDESYNKFSTNILNIGENAVLSLQNSGQNQPYTEDNLPATAKIENFTHNGLLDLADGSDAPKFSHLPINNYETGGTLSIDSVWNQDPATSGNDILHILGNLNYTAKPTKVITKKGIIGDIIRTDEEQYSPVVVKVEKEHSDIAFVGKARTKNAGEAQLKKKGNNYYWYLGASRFSASSAYIQTPTTNMELMYSSANAIPTQNFAYNKALWGQIIGKHLSLNGERLYYKQQHRIAQIGYTFPTYSSKYGIYQNGIYLGFALDKLRFYDNLRAENGLISKDHYDGSAKTRAGLVGFYHHSQWQNDVYLNLVTQLSYLKNSYRPREGEHLSQNGVDALISAKIGKIINLNNNWVIKPETQLIAQHLHLQGIMDQDIAIERQNYHNVRGSIGGSLVKNSDNFQLGLSAHIWRNLLKGGNTKIGDTNYHETYATTWLDIGLNTTWKLSNQVELYANLHIEHSLSKQKRDAYQGTIGFRTYW